MHLNKLNKLTTRGGPLLFYQRRGPGPKGKKNIIGMPYTSAFVRATRYISRAFAVRLVDICMYVRNEIIIECDATRGC